MTAFADDFAGAAGPLDGRVSPTGHVWSDINASTALDGAGRASRVLLGSDATGSYNQIDLDAPVTRMSAQISFTGQSDVVEKNDGFAVISASDPSYVFGPPAKRHAFENMIHPVFGPWAFSMSLYQGGLVQEPNPKLFLVYPGGRLLLDGTVYDIAVEFRGIIMTCRLPWPAASPDPRPPELVRQFADPLIRTMAGRYLIWQTTNSLSGGLLSPRYESVAAETDQLPGFIPSAPFPAVLGGELWS